MLRKLFNKAADSFDQVQTMVTRQLPIPQLEGTDKHVQFTATRGKDGYWTITSKHNLRQMTGGLQTVSRAYQAAATKHTGQTPEKGGDFKLNFDNAFLILRDMEESLLKYDGTTAKEEPKHHYMAAYRLLPVQFREGLDDLFFSRTEKKGEIMEPKPKKDPKKETGPVAQPAANPKNPKPN